MTSYNKSKMNEDVLEAFCDKCGKLHTLNGKCKK